MRGRVVMAALALAIALVLCVRVVLVKDGNEAARSYPAISRPQLAKDFAQAPEGSARTANPPDAKPERRALPSAGEQARGDAEPSEQGVREPAAQNSTPNRTARAGLEPSSVDNSVIGRAFPVSESVFIDCENLRRRYLCEPNKALLAEMTGEPREEPWANSAERAIRSLVEMEPGTDRPRAVNYTIRALECRTTICFLETASIMQSFHTQLFYFERAHALRAGYSSFGIETDEFGNTTYVTLTPFTRNLSMSE